MGLTDLLSSKSVRYGVVGLGHIAQAAVLPAFGQAKSSKLTALVSGDAKKLRSVAKEYGIEATFSYDQFEQCLRSGEVDAVYIALPNSMHRDFAVQALKRGIHVLCEKPMALSSKDCQDMINAKSKSQAKLMVAYRLHLEKANVQAAEIARSGKIGDVHLFNSIFSFQVKEDNIRTRAEMGGGPLWDIGIYCINAARYVFQAEPTEVFATAVSSSDERFKEVPETVSVIMTFPGDRIANFSASFGLTDRGYFELVGTKGRLLVDPAYEWSEPLKHQLVVGSRVSEKEFRQVDHFAGEIQYFSQCILKNLEVEPSGEEGLIDVRIIEACHKSLQTHKPVSLASTQKTKRPEESMIQEVKPPRRQPKLVDVEAPHGEATQ